MTRSRPAENAFDNQSKAFKEDGVRVTTAFNRLLNLPGTRVTDVSFTADGVAVCVALRRRRAACSSCGQVCPAYDRKTRRWRHLDLGASACFVECELRRVRCRDCGVRVEAVPFARAGARHTRDFEDVVAFLAQQMAKTPLAKLMRVAWSTVGAIVERVVGDHLDHRRLARLVQIGVDEISYRKGQRYLTCVADHESGNIVWSAPGRSAATLRAFFDLLGGRKDSIEAVSIDMSGGYEKAIREHLPGAEICFDPFHVVQLATRAVDELRRAEWRDKGKSKTAAGRWVKGARWSLLKAPDKQSSDQLFTLAQVGHANKRLYRGFLLKEELRMLYRLDDPADAPDHLDAWLSWASRSKLAPFVKLARTIRKHREGILAAVRLGLSNGRLEGLNSKIRLISHRSFGFHSPGPLIATIYLCCGGVEVGLPGRA